MPCQALPHSADELPLEQAQRLLPNVGARPTPFRRTVLQDLPPRPTASTGICHKAEPFELLLGQDLPPS